MKTLALSIIILALTVILNLLFTCRIQQTLLHRIEEIENNYQHLLHRMNVIEYPEVLGKEDTERRK